MIGAEDPWPWMARPSDQGWLERVRNTDQPLPTHSISLYNARDFPESLMASTLAAPRYWLTWLGVGLMWLVARLPLRAQFALGRAIGAVGPSLRACASTHRDRPTSRCVFRNSTPPRATRWCGSIFTSTGIGAVETAIAWFGDVARLRERVTFDGLDALTTAQQRGRGVMLIGAHFSTLDLAGALLSQAIDLDVIYRYNKNPVIEWAMRHGRERRFKAVIERSDARTVLTRLKDGHTVWYAADQDYGRKVSVFAPFFGVTAATITAPPRDLRDSTLRPSSSSVTSATRRRRRGRCIFGKSTHFRAPTRSKTRGASTR